MFWTNPWNTALIERYVSGCLFLDATASVVNSPVSHAGDAFCGISQAIVGERLTGIELTEPHHVAVNFAIDFVERHVWTVQQCVSRKRFEFFRNHAVGDSAVGAKGVFSKPGLGRDEARHR